MAETDPAIAAQLVNMSEKIGEIRTDVAVIKVQTSAISDHDARIRSLEISRSRIWAWWSVAAVMGAGLGYFLSLFARIK